jgi:hypothetical protein
VTPFLAVAALLPGIYWDHGTQAAPSLREVAPRLFVPVAEIAAWREAGVNAAPLDDATRAQFLPATAPKVEYRPDVASATAAPWIDANGWLFQKRPRGRYFYELPEGAAALAAAESFAYGVDAVLHIQPGDLDAAAAMLAFLKSVDEPPRTPLANIGVIDDHSPELDEVLNLLARRNLLFRVLTAPDAALDLNVRASEGPSDPYEFASRVRQRLGDDRRLLRIYGSETTIGYLTGSGARARLHLLNYARRSVGGMRVRLRGNYRKAVLRVAGIENAAPADWVADAGAVEFTVPEMRVYAVVDLE